MAFKTRAWLVAAVSLLAYARVATAVSFHETAVNATNILAVQNDPVVIDQAVIQFNVWVLLFCCCIASLLLSVCLHRSDDFTGGLAVLFAAFCLYSVPTLSIVCYDTGVTTINTSAGILTTSVVTPVILQVGNLPLVVLVFGVFIASALNLVRIISRIVVSYAKPADLDELEEDNKNSHDIEGMGEERQLQQHTTGFTKRREL